MPEVVKARLACHLLLNLLPDDGLAEARESLEQMRRFYTTPVASTQAKPAPITLPARVTGSRARPVFPVTEEPSEAEHGPGSEEVEIVDPAVVLPPGLRPTTLSPEHARAIQEFLAGPRRPAHAGKRMPDADASVLRKNRDGNA